VAAIEQRRPTAARQRPGKSSGWLGHGSALSSSCPGVVGWSKITCREPSCETAVERRYQSCSIGATLSHMADWISLLVQIGATGAVLVIAVGVMGRWLWRKIDTALSAYTNKYLEQKAAIDARIASLEKLVEEQARLTRTVESIKDEIAAQRKSHDNRWEFRKDVYVKLITTIHALLKSLHNMADALTLRAGSNPDLRRLSVESFGAEVPIFQASITALTSLASLAPLATADDVLPLLARANKKVFFPIDLDAPDAATRIQEQIAALFALMNQLQSAGRKDLWGDSEAEVKAETL
jgi:hypothetical protein